MKILSRDSITMKIVGMCGCLLSIALATPIPKGTQKNAWEKLNPKQVAEIQQDVQALTALAAKILPKAYGDPEAQDLLSSTTESDASDQENDETDYSYDPQNYRSSDENDQSDKDEDYESDDSYDSQKYEIDESDDENEGEGRDFSDVEINTKEQKNPPSPEASKGSEKKVTKKVKDQADTPKKKKDH